MVCEQRKSGEKMVGGRCIVLRFTHPTRERRGDPMRMNFQRTSGPLWPWPAWRHAAFEVESGWNLNYCTLYVNSDTTDCGVTSGDLLPVVVLAQKWGRPFACRCSGLSGSGLASSIFTGPKSEVLTSQWRAGWTVAHPPRPSAL